MLRYVRGQSSLGGSLFYVLHLTEARLGVMASSSPLVDQALKHTHLPVPLNRAFVKLEEGKRLKSARVISADEAAKMRTRVPPELERHGVYVRLVSTSQFTGQVGCTSSLNHNHSRADIAAVNTLFQLPGNQLLSVKALPIVVRFVDFRSLVLGAWSHVCECGTFGLRSCMCVCAYTALRGSNPQEDRLQLGSHGSYNVYTNVKPWSNVQVTCHAHRLIHVRQLQACCTCTPS
jgi:hypothetical protein